MTSLRLILICQSARRHPDPTGLFVPWCYHTPVFGKVGWRKGRAVEVATQTSASVIDSSVVIVGLFTMLFHSMDSQSRTVFVVPASPPNLLDW